MISSVEPTRQLVRLRGRSYVAFVFSPVVPIIGWLEEIDATLARSPNFFVGKPVVLDLSAVDLAGLLDHVPAKRQLVVNMTSCSGGSRAVLEKLNRVVITATKSGSEKNATIFARYWSEALRDPSADVDKNESVSALEAFQYADRKIAEFYTAQKRLATEHAVFEDTGKGEAVRAPSTDGGEGRLLASLTLVRFGESQKAALDPAKRDLLAKKEDLQRRIDVLKYQKAAMTQNNYDQQLKALLVELARVQATLDK